MRLRTPDGRARSQSLFPKSIGLLAVAMVFLHAGLLKAQSGSDVDLIEAARQASNQAIAWHDVDGVISFLDADYVITVSNGAILRSRDEMAVEFKQHFAEFPDVVYVRTPSSITVSASHPLAMENGTWVGTRTTKNGHQEIGGQYAAGWKKVDGIWKIHSELFVALYCKGADC